MWVVAHSLLIFRTDNKPDQTPTLIVQSIADFCGVHEESTLLNLSYVNPGTLITRLKRIDLCAQAHLVIGANHSYYFRLDHNRMATVFFLSELSFLKLGSEVTQKHLALFLIGEPLLH